MALKMLGITLEKIIRGKEIKAAAVPAIAPSPEPTGSLDVSADDATEKKATPEDEPAAKENGSDAKDADNES